MENREEKSGENVNFGCLVKGRKNDGFWWDLGVSPRAHKKSISLNGWKTQEKTHWKKTTTSFPLLPSLTSQNKNSLSSLSQRYNKR